MERTWLVLGGTSPVGRAFALEAAGHGSKLLLAGRNADELETIAADIRLRSGQAVNVLVVDACETQREGC